MPTPYGQFVKPRLAQVLKALGQDVAYCRAEGDTLFYRDEADREVPVLDLLGGYGATILGHNHPELVNAAKAFLDRQGVVHAQFSERRVSGALAEMLSGILQCETGLQEGFITTFSNSGAEAIEVALKHAELARVLRLQKIIENLEDELDEIRLAVADVGLVIPEDLFRKTELVGMFEKIQGVDHAAMALTAFNAGQLQHPPVIVALENSFHGKLMGSVQLTYGENYRAPFKSLGLNVRFVRAGDEAELDRLAEQQKDRYLYGLKVRNGVAVLTETPLPMFTAVVIEPIQGEGGINLLERDFALALKRFCNQQKCPLIVDEIQSGMGRSGRFLASSHLQLTGDYYALSKSLGGGIAKIAATAIRKTLYEENFSLIHSSTFAEDDFSSTIALKTLELLEQNEGALYRQISLAGASLQEGFARLQNEYPELIKSVRGRGLLLGIEFYDQRQSPSMIIRGAAYSKSLGYLMAGFLLHRHGIRVSAPASASNVIRIEPSAFLAEDNIQKIFLSFEQLCLALRNADALPFVAAAINCRRSTLRAVINDFRPANLASTHLGRQATPAGQKVTKVGFINHLIKAHDLIAVDPSLADLTEQECCEFVGRMEVNRTAAPFPPVRIQSATGALVDFILYPLCVDSGQMSDYLSSGDVESIRDAVQDRLNAARKDGCEVVGLGMYTSIVTNNGQSLSRRGTAVTSGNALTIAMGLEAIEQAAREAGIDLASAHLVVVGAAGNIASTFTSTLCDKVAKVSLVGSRREGSDRRLWKTVHKIYDDIYAEILANLVHSGIGARVAEIPEIRSFVVANPTIPDPGRVLAEKVVAHFGQDPFFHVTSSLHEVSKGEIVLCAANAPEAFLNSEHFKANAIVCDIAVPHNVVTDIGQRRPDVRYLQGGIVATPNGESLDTRARAFLNEGELYACMAESVVLGMNRYSRCYSFGDISKRQVKEIAEYARLHGFRLAAIKVDASL